MGSLKQKLSVKRRLRLKNENRMKKLRTRGKRRKGLTEERKKKKAVWGGKRREFITVRRRKTPNLWKKLVMRRENMLWTSAFQPFKNKRKSPWKRGILKNGGTIYR